MRSRAASARRLTSRGSRKASAFRRSSSFAGSRAASAPTRTSSHPAFPPQAHDRLLDAEVALGLGDTMEAERLFTAALDPETARARARARRARRDRVLDRRARGAVALLEEAAQTHPQGAFAVAGPLGRAYAQLSDCRRPSASSRSALEDCRATYTDSFERLR